jgi:hypothetical protein
MKVLLSGSSGFIGHEVIGRLEGRDHSVVRLVRGTPMAGDISWDPAGGRLAHQDLDGIDAVVHLAGENIAGGRWTAARKERIRTSRVAGTSLLAGTMARAAKPPSVLVCASAIGYYGDRGAEILDEESAPGRGFLAEVCREWEAACEPARKRGLRVVHLRIGIVLGKGGGALASMLTPFRLGVGGRIGEGRQYWSWVTLDDVSRAVRHAIETESVGGPVNVVAPGAVTNTEFTRALGRVLGRPTLLPMPAFAARLALGEMADALLLASTRVEPRRLVASGFVFQHREIEGALRDVLGRS